MASTRIYVDCHGIAMTHLGLPHLSSEQRDSEVPGQEYLSPEGL